ncbi:MULTISPECIES: hypothetical protein [Halorussus]|uniref:hypothetical protein n=1 Tax=Halorussus TaxID=1070314 RepID=UPI00209E5441|nr:hypothetical protein [Halorussus vallis]USZ74053.1 hypothetical protein NGM07_11360 [Halorussus vallis]
MTDDAGDGDDVIDPAGLDPETLRQVEQAVRGFRMSDPDEQYADLSEYESGRHDAYSSVLAMLSKWLDEQEK